MTIQPERVEEFEEQRGRLFAVAYRMLGSASEAEDTVQDAFLRWSEADHAAVRTPAAWLTKAVTNLCLTRLTSARARREAYVGPWLPEPVATSERDPLDAAEQRDSVSMAFLLLLERLTPPERAVFVLREAFGYSHREIAEVLDRTEASCQQLYRRAGQRVADDRPRFTASREEGERITRRFIAAARGADVAELERLFADDVVSWADGGGKVSAARRPILGRDKVVRYISGWMGMDIPGLEFTYAEINGEPGLIASVHGVVRLAGVLEVAEGRIVAMRLVANPDKLTYLAGQSS